MIQLPANESYKVALYGDLHCDTHDNNAVALACKIFKVFKPTLAINVGDGINLDAISSYLTDPRRTAIIQKELDVYYDVQTQINAATGAARRIFIRGNHEKRLENAIKRRLPGLIHLSDLKAEKVMRLAELGMDYTEEGVMIGNSVQIVHGWASRKWSGTSPRQGLEALGYSHSYVQGHSHRQSIISKATYRGPVFGVEVGCLVDQNNLDYLSGPADWQRGITLLEFKDGKSAFEIIPFFGNIKLTALWRGRLYRS